MTIPKRTEEVLQEHLEAKTALLGLDVTNHSNNMLEQWANLTGAQHVPLYNKGKGNLGNDGEKTPKSTGPTPTMPMPPQAQDVKSPTPSPTVPISVQQGPAGNAGTTETPYITPKAPVVPDTVPPEWAPHREPAFVSKMESALAPEMELALASKRANPLMQLVEKLESMICGCGQKAHSMFNNMPHCTPGEGCCSNSTKDSDDCGSCGDPSAAGTFHGMSICAPGQGCNKGFMGTGETLPEILKHNEEHDDWAAKTNHGQFAMPGEGNKPEAPLGLAASKISTWVTASKHTAGQWGPTPGGDKNCVGMRKGRDKCVGELSKNGYPNKADGGSQCKQCENYDSAHMSSRLAASKISTWVTAHDRDNDGDDDDNDAGKSNEDEFGNPTYSDESIEDDFK